MIAMPTELGNLSLQEMPSSLLLYARQAATDGVAAHDAEREIFNRVLALGREALGLFFRLNGTGDLGEQVHLPDGTTAQRLPQPHERLYRSVFGDFTLQRFCYGSREGQKILFCPLDSRLQLPEGCFSYLLQQWDQTLGAECAWARVAATLEDMLGVKQSVDSLELGNLQMAQTVEPFREARPLPECEGQIFVLSADGKGVVMRREEGEAAPGPYLKKGEKANKKRMAIVGAVYSVDPHVRTPEQLTAALFRDAQQPDEAADRPEPVGKHLQARLSQAADGSLAQPLAQVFGSLSSEMHKRKTGDGPVVCLMDGQQCLWDAAAKHIKGEVVEVLDILHVTPRLWQAAHLFCEEGSDEARQFVRERLLRVLRGEVQGVVKGLRRMGTMRELGGEKKKTLRTLCNYLEGNASRMRYDEYLGAGYPVASGVIEGACRHYVKDRMERAGMRWSRQGAQAMLDVRSEYLNGDWQGFQAFRIATETVRLYPHRHMLETVAWPLAA